MFEMLCGSIAGAIFMLLLISSVIGLKTLRELVVKSL